MNPDTNFIIDENPVVHFVKESIDVLIGLFVFILIIRLLIFLVSYIAKTALSIITLILSAFKIDDNNSRNNIHRRNRPSLYKESPDKNKNYKYELKPKPKSIQPNKPLVDDKYKHLNFEQLKDEMNKKY